MNQIFWPSVCLLFLLLFLSRNVILHTGEALTNVKIQKCHWMSISVSLIFSKRTQTAGRKMKTVGGEACSINHINSYPPSYTEEPKTEEKLGKCKINKREIAELQIQTNVCDAMWNVVKFQEMSTYFGRNILSFFKGAYIIVCCYVGRATKILHLSF